MYDKDNSGSIELAEMIEIIGTLYEMEGVSKVNDFSPLIQIKIQKVEILDTMNIK